MSALEKDLAAPILARLYFFKPTTIIVEGAKPSMQKQMDTQRRTHSRYLDTNFWSLHGEHIPRMRKPIQWLVKA